MRTRLIATTAAMHAAVHTSVDRDQCPLRTLTKVVALRITRAKFATDEHPGAMNMEPEPSASGTTLPVVDAPTIQPMRTASSRSIASLNAANKSRDQNK